METEPSRDGCACVMSQGLWEMGEQPHPGETKQVSRNGEGRPVPVCKCGPTDPGP